MSSESDWQDANTRYLTAALVWLRALMESLMGPQQERQDILPVPLSSPASPEARRNTSWLNFGRRPSAPPAPPTPQAPTAILPRAGGTAEQRVAEAAAAMQAIAAEMKPPPPLWILAERLGLSVFEQQVLTLCVAMELDTGLAGLCAQCQHDPTRPYPTFALGFALFADPTWEALSPERPLRQWRLLEIMQSGTQALTTSALRADERIVNYCKGLNYLDDRLLPLLSTIPARANQPDLPPSHRKTEELVLRRLKSNASEPGIPIVQLLGTDSTSKRTVAADLVAALDLHLYRLSASAMPTQSVDVDTFARLWQRESLLLPVALYVEAPANASAGGASVALTRLLDRLQGVIFLDTRETWSGLQRPSAQFEVTKPTATEQATEWSFFLGQNAGDSPAQLAAQFDLSFETIRQLATRATSDSSDQTPLTPRLWDACLAETRPELDVLAQRVPAKASWKDLVLPDPEVALLHQIAEQIHQRTLVYEKWGFANKMSRGLGVSALFAGDSGTGKTMAAEVIAAELRLNLYRIDLSAVVSKYIGETEKNLRRLFDSAENGGAILFFDEADALFGKRSEVKDSHDRYANIEINYLLQRMEAYRGLAILATNMKSALDPAFMRRLRFIVTFPFPGPAQRKAIWQSVFPEDLPRETLDYDRLSRLHATGGNIHSIALNAAFLAAKAGSPVTMPLVLEAARAEFRKLERPVNEADFRWRAPHEAVA